MKLNKDTITFGKYKNKHIRLLLKDRKYVTWLLNQDFFKNYEYLYNIVSAYKPQTYFINDIIEKRTGFIYTYKFFHLKEVSKVTLNLNKDEKVCYDYYFQIVNELKTELENRQKNKEENIYDITVPSRWLLKFEKETSLSRETFKTFLYSYDLPNITTIIEDIKKEGNISYKGAQSYNIAKQKSKEQELYWEKILKQKYGENINAQFKYKNCIFDFINIDTNCIYECKLHIKDFNETQYNKYILALEKYQIIYLIDTDCIVNMSKKKIITTDPYKYMEYLENKYLRDRKPISGNCFEELIISFKISKSTDLLDVL